MTIIAKLVLETQDVGMVLLGSNLQRELLWHRMAESVCLLFVCLSEMTSQKQS